MTLTEFVVALKIHLDNNPTDGFLSVICDHGMPKNVYRVYKGVTGDEYFSVGCHASEIWEHIRNVDLFSESVG